MIPFLLPIGDMLRIYILVMQYVRHRNMQIGVGQRNRMMDHILFNFLQLCSDYIQLINILARYVNNRGVGLWYKTSFINKTHGSIQVSFPYYLHMYIFYEIIF